MKPGLAKIWDRLWFSPGPASNLAAARIIVSGHAIWMILSRDIPSLSDLPASFWSRVPPAVRWRYLLFPGHAASERLAEVLAVTGLLAVLLGVWPRLAAGLSALLLYHLAPLQALYATSNPYNRGLTISTLALVVLAASRSGDCWSLRLRGGACVATRDSWEYTWPLRLMQLFVAQIYLFGFYGKLVKGGPGWFTPANLRHNLVLYQHVDPSGAITGLGPWLARSPLALWLGIGGVVFVELGLVAAVFSRRARLVVPAAIAFHIMILLTMNIVFMNIVHLLLFVNWDGLRPSFSRFGSRALAHS